MPGKAIKTAADFAPAIKKKNAQQLAWNIAAAHMPPETQTRVIEFTSQCGILNKEELEIITKDAGDLVNLTTTGKLSCLAVTTAFCKAAAVAHRHTNFLTEIFFTQARERTKELDASFKETGKPAEALFGLPISLKDQFEIKGTECDMGIASWIGHISENNSVLVEVLQNVGAITNISQTLMRLTANPSSGGGEGATVAMWIYPHPSRLQRPLWFPSNSAPPPLCQCPQYPPVRRATDMAVGTLKKAGYEDGSEDLRRAFAPSGELYHPMVVVAEDTPHLSTYENWQLNLEKYEVVTAWLKAWNATAERTSTGQPIDGILLPPSANVAQKHGEWPRNIIYTSLFNMIDYPGMIIPVNSAVDPVLDPIDKDFKATNEKDAEIQAMYNPGEFVGVPIAVQVRIENMI
ncbi:hypothetical protein G7Y89_g7441 [Cudoniella acicularis]|uniref:Amidase domain-containing protein n=1 Tax=Cudoniella acicularis TaxID=354080 RepID=A0A8H4RK35_9HELO|nr:hypothetical protein G7Y89_g7441 [Cudoniella acicularis]